MTKLVALPLDASPTLDDLVYVVGSPGTVPVDRKVPLGDLAAPLAAATDFTDAYVPKGVLVINAKDAPYNATGLGIADDTAEIQAALDAAGASVAFGAQTCTGMIVFLPKGAYMISAQLVTPKNVWLVGAGRLSTILRVTAGFPINTPVTRLGPGTNTVSFGTQIRDLCINCGGIAGSTGVYSNEGQEGSGVFGCLIRQATAYGIHLDTPGAPSAANLCRVEDCQIWGDDNSTGIRTEVHSAIRDTTIVALTGTLVDGIYISSGVAVENCHVETCDVGVRVANSGEAFIADLLGHSTVPTLVEIDAEGVDACSRAVLLRLDPNGGTNTVVDNVSGVTLAKPLMFYAVGGSDNTRGPDKGHHMVGAGSSANHVLNVRNILGRVSDNGGILAELLNAIDTGTAIHGKVNSGSTALAAKFEGGAVVLSGAALATNATKGHTYIPTCAGTPTGVPTAATGTVPLIFDTTNNRLYVYDGGWQAQVPAGTLTQFIDPNGFVLAAGTPALDPFGGDGGTLVWQFDAGSTESIQCNLIAQNHWGASVDLDLWWMNDGAGAGAVHWRVQIWELTPGSATRTAIIDQQTSVTAAAQDVATLTTGFISGLTTLVPGRLYEMKVTRLGTHGGDTLANDAGFMGLTLGAT